MHSFESKPCMNYHFHTAHHLHSTFQRKNSLPNSACSDGFNRACASRAGTFHSCVARQRRSICDKRNACKHEIRAHAPCRARQRRTDHPNDCGTPTRTAHELCAHNPTTRIVRLGGALVRLGGAPLVRANECACKSCRPIS